MILTAVAIAIVAGLVDYFFGIPEPWRRIIYIAAVILLIVGVLMLLVPGLIPLHMPRV